MENQHYNAKYFDWQKSMGAFGAKANFFQIEPYISETDVVLDFGCGGGYYLAALNVKKKMGIEINDTARAAAKEQGLEVFKDIDSVEDESIDKIFSNSVLEHLHNPLESLVALRSKLKDNGICIFTVLHEKILSPWHDNDINMHLYTWNEMTLGNLFKQAGYTIQEVKVFQHTWPPNYQGIVERAKRRGWSNKNLLTRFISLFTNKKETEEEKEIYAWEVFHEKAVAYAKKNNIHQIQIIAKK